MSTNSIQLSRSASPSVGPVSIKGFSSDRIQEIHRALVSYFASSTEPIRDLGLRDASLLEQAVSHQFSGADGGNHPLEQPAALLQGLFDELPFHDGNAQTAFLALLLLLDENGYVPNRVSFEMFFAFCAALSEHRLEPVKPQSKPGRSRPQAGHESELALIRQWLEEHTKPEAVRDHPLALPELRRLLAGHGYELTGGMAGAGEFLELHHVVPERKKGLFGLGTGRKQAVSAPLHTLPAPAVGALLSLTAVRGLRKSCELETDQFYDWRARVDSMLHQYQTLLVRLGRL